jgi:hypothetical protein
MMKPRDLKPKSIAVKIVMGYETVPDPDKPGKTKKQGREEILTLQLLSKHEWEEIGAMIDDPIPPKKKNGDLDFMSMRYRTEAFQVDFRRNVLRLAHALANGGGFEFEGDTLEEQAEELADIDRGVFNALFAVIQNATNTWDLKVSTSADTFRSEPLQETESEYSTA